MTLVASALAGGDFDDAASGASSSTLLPQPAGRELLARAWAAGAGPGDAPLTIDLDSTICETYGLAKEGARRTVLSPAAGLAAGTGEVLMARLREGRANTVATSCGHGEPGALHRSQGTTHGAGRQRLLHPSFVCRMQVRFSITVRQHKSLLITRGGLEVHPLLDGRCRRRGRNHLHSLPERCRTGAAHNPPGETHARLRCSYRSGGDTLVHPGPEVRRGAQPPPLGAILPSGAAQVMAPGRVPAGRRGHHLQASQSIASGTRRLASSTPTRRHQRPP